MPTQITVVHTPGLEKLWGPPDSAARHVGVKGEVEGLPWGDILGWH